MNCDIFIYHNIEAAGIFATHEWKTFNVKIQSLCLGQGMKEPRCI